MTDGERGVGALGEEMMAAEDEQMVIPVSWFQRLSRNQVLTLIGLATAAGLWIYDLNGDVISMKERLARTETKLEAMQEQFQKSDKDMSVAMADLKATYQSINQRLAFIETNVRKMAQ
jgi:hypothetical protein